MTPCRFPPPRWPRSRREFVAQRAGYPSPHASAPARRNRRPRSRRHRRTRRPARCPTRRRHRRSQARSRPGPRRTRPGSARRAARRSNVWFTLQGGRMSEVFYPDLSTPSVRSLELRRHRRRDVHRPRVDGHDDHGRDRPDPRSLRFTQIEHRQGRALPAHGAVRHRSPTATRRRQGAAAPPWTAGATGSTRCLDPALDQRRHGRHRPQPRRGAVGDRR